MRSQDNLGIPKTITLKQAMVTLKGMAEPRFSNNWQHFTLLWYLKIGKYMAKLIFLWIDNFGDNQNPLQGNGMAFIPKIKAPKRNIKF